MDKKRIGKPLDIDKLISTYGDQPLRMPILSYNIGEFEDEAMREGSKAITSLENAIASWDALKKKPESLVPTFKRYKWFRDALVEWMTGMLKSRKTGEDFFSRLKRLDRFVEICNEYRGNS